MHKRSERFLTFYLDSQLCAFRVELIREINNPEGELNPTAMEIQLRGQSLRLFDLRTRLGLERRTPTPTSRLIVLKAEGLPTAALVDAVHSVIDLYADQWEALSESDALPFPQQSLFVGIATWRGQTVLLLDPQILLKGRRERTIA